MAEAADHDHIVEKLYDILASLNSEIHEHRQKHQQEIGVLLHRLKQKELEIARLKSINLQKSATSSQKQTQLKKHVSITTVISRKKSLHQKQINHIKSTHHESKPQHTKIAGVEMINSISCNRSKDKSTLKISAAGRSTSRRKSADLIHSHPHNTKQQTTDRRCYAVRKKIAIDNKQNHLAPNLIHSLSYKTPVNKHYLSATLEASIATSLSATGLFEGTAAFEVTGVLETTEKEGLRVKEGLREREAKDGNRVQESKGKQGKCVKSQSRKQIRVVVPVKKVPSNKKSLS